jgi:CheY-like chemotaxis protein
MSGLNALKVIKGNDAPCIVIFATGSAVEEDRREAMRLGADYYLTKPVSIAGLRALIAKL